MKLFRVKLLLGDQAIIFAKDKESARQCFETVVGKVEHGGLTKSGHDIWHEDLHIVSIEEIKLRDDQFGVICNYGS